MMADTISAWPRVFWLRMRAGARLANGAVWGQ
jgi:hypothetical protein